VNWVKFIDLVIVTYCSFGFDIKTRIILVKWYNGIIFVRLRIIIFTCVHLIYTNSAPLTSLFTLWRLSILPLGPITKGYIVSSYFFLEKFSPAQLIVARLLFHVDSFLCCHPIFLFPSQHLSCPRRGSLNLGVAFWCSSPSQLSRLEQWRRRLERQWCSSPSCPHAHIAQSVEMRADMTEQQIGPHLPLSTGMDLMALI
jgi:hypothetical protein